MTCLCEGLWSLCLCFLRMWFLLFQLLTTILDEPTQGLYLERGEVTLTRTRGERKEFVSLLFLQGTESSNISIWLPSPECCPSKQCKDLLLELQSRSMAVKSFYLSLNWLHVILQPWLWLAGSPSDEAYVVRKAKRENGLCCVILENIKTDLGDGTETGGDSEARGGIP